MAPARLIRWLALAAAVVGLSAPLLIPRISWVDALKAELAHYQQIERNLS